mgnify:FL=1|tara:strand:+ start:4653 stop:4853 length:201 start_codon:yes stop_codon:yes gene_type:complete
MSDDKEAKAIITEAYALLSSQKAWTSSEAHEELLKRIRTYLNSFKKNTLSTAQITKYLNQYPKKNK